MYAYARTNTPKLPWKPRSRPIDLGKSWLSRYARSAPFEDASSTTRGTGREGSIRSHTAIGPAPRPPPPWGWGEDFWGVKWAMSNPPAPRRRDPITGVQVAPSE